MNLDRKGAAFAANEVGRSVFFRAKSGCVLAGGMDEKKAPCIGGIEDGRADALAAPSVLLPAWLNL